MRISDIDQIPNPLVTQTGEIIHELIGRAAGGDTAPNHSLARIVIPNGKSSAPHYHKVSEESYFILQGEGQMVVDGNRFTISPGQACLIEPGEVHQISNQGDIDLVFLAVCVPAWEPGDSYEVGSS